MSRILIAYYSRADENYLSGRLRYLKKGNTEKVAEMIQEETGGDLFKIEQEIPYSKDYNTCIEEAKSDLHSNARPRLRNWPESLDGYDEIYLGYPIYWGTFPMAVFTFLEGFDLVGKKIHPFCTHEGSGLGQSLRDLMKLAPNSTICDSLSIFGTNVDTSRGMVKDYVKREER